MLLGHKYNWFHIEWLELQHQSLLLYPGEKRPLERNNKVPFNPIKLLKIKKSPFITCSSFEDKNKVNH